MSSWRRALMTVPPAALVLLSLAPTRAATPAVDPGAFAHCRSITAADERLACYDALGRPKPSPSPAATQTAGAAAATGAAAPHAAAAGATTAAAAAAVTPDEKSFGLGAHPPPVEEGPERIQAKVTSYSADRLGKVRVALDNGQTWTFTATDALLRVGDQVTIKRAALGSFLLTTPSHHTYRVVRAQ